MGYDRVITFRPDTAANWSSNNPVLSSGEGAYETDTGRFKIGDGINAYNSLAYYSPYNEDWHVVGDSGEPAFEDSWANYGSPYATAAFRKDSNGFVHIKGFVKDGTVGSAYAIFTLPTGYRPTEMLVMPTRTYSGSGRLDITTGGVIVPQSGSNTWYSICGIVFYGAQ